MARQNTCCLLESWPFIISAPGHKKPQYVYLTENDTSNFTFDKKKSLDKGNYWVSKLKHTNNLKKGGTLWGSGEHFYQKSMHFFKFEICHDLHTFETIFRLNVGNILDDWDRLRIIYLFFLLFKLYFSPYFLSGSD